MYNNMWHGAPYFDTEGRCILGWFPRKNKDPLQPSSYRPISLINVDAKLSKIIADRLADILPSLINSSQSGFVKGGSGVAKIRKVLLTLEHSKSNPAQDNVIITFEAEKAFDILILAMGWAYWQYWPGLAISCHGAHGVTGQLHGFFSSTVCPFHSENQMAMVLSEAFVLHKGTRQGCLLSPLLFNFAIEPLARYIHQSNDIKGMQLSASQNLKLAMFADNLLLFTSSPDTDLL